MSYGRVYTEAERAFIRDNVKGRFLSELVEIFNASFSPPITYGQLKSYTANHHLNNGMDGRFAKGQESWNKGIHKATSAENARTYFKVGNRPHNTQEVGAEVVEKGYVFIKIAEPNVWKPKQVYLYEQANGKVPAGSVVIFADGDNRNFDIDNLICVTRAELAVLCRRHLISREKELTKLGILTAKVMLKGAEVRKKKAKSKE